MGTHRSCHGNQVPGVSQANTSHWSQTDLLTVLAFSCAAGATSQTLADVEDGSGFAGLGVVSHTDELGGEDGAGGRSFVGVELWNCCL